MLKRYNEKKLERELPLALRSLATEMATGVPFEQCLAHLSDGFGELSKDIRKMVREISHGKSVPEALYEWGNSKRSKEIKQVAHQLISSYEGREDPYALKKLAMDLVAKRKIELKKYSGKVVMYSVAFIVVSAVFPALFQTFVIVGTAFMDFTITPIQALLIPVVVFPLIDLIMLAMMLARRPV
ncbi:MAG: type II secretion system F family protein [Candidatus Diapherotrites archaeon]|nr:type II secretion system F family protein [Candidatus Diapherotrites archaeon]